MGKENLDKIMKTSRMKIAVSKFEEEEHTMPKRNLLKMVATFALTIGMTVGLVYAGNTVYEKIWKEPKAYKINQEITEEEKAECISETEAEEIAKAYLKKIGYTDDNIGQIELYKDNLSQENIWAMGSELGTIRIDANTGKLRSVSMPVREGSIPYNYGISREEARSVAYELLEKYKPIGDTGEYELVSLKRNAEKDEDAYIWYAEFHKKYGDLYNASESIKIGWIPTSNILYSLDIKQNPYENNEEKISQEEAIQIAKEKDEQIETVREIQEVKAEIKIKQMNEEVYLRENLKENYGNIMLNMEKVEGDLYRYKDDAVMYKTEERVRRVWCVVITYNPEKSGYLPAFTYYVDSTTGEIIGGGAGDVLASEEAEKNDVNNVIEK